MKALLIAVAFAGVAGLVGWKIADARKTPLVQKPGPAAPRGAAAPLPAAAANPASAPVAPAAGAVKPDAAGMALAETIDTLISAQSSFGQKWAIWEQLRKSGQLPEVIATLKQLAAENPKDPAVATALGEAQINQLRNIVENHGDPSEVAILALQADQNFNAALTADQTNWEAQFEKAASMSHWPPMMNKGPEVIQRLSALVAQQEATTAQQPEFAQTYALLGEQYRAAGQAAQAAQIWQQGLARFPVNSTLQNELTHAANP